MCVALLLRTQSLRSSMRTRQHDRFESESAPLTLPCVPREAEDLQIKVNGTLPRTLLARMGCDLTSRTHAQSVWSTLPSHRDTPVTTRLPCRTFVFPTTSFGGNGIGTSASSSACLVKPIALPCEEAVPLTLLCGLAGCGIAASSVQFNGACAAGTSSPTASCVLSSPNTSRPAMWTLVSGSPGDSRQLCPAVVSRQKINK